MMICSSSSRCMLLEKYTPLLFFLPPASRRGWESLGWGRPVHQGDKPRPVALTPNIPWSCLPDQLPWGGQNLCLTDPVIILQLPGGQVHDMVAVGSDLGEQLSHTGLCPVSAYHWQDVPQHVRLGDRAVNVRYHHLTEFGSKHVMKVT